METRLELQNKLEELLGVSHVYYQPPESLKIEYPAIIYSLSDIDLKYASNSSYTKKRRYTLIVIDRRPDNPVIDKLLELPYCSFDRRYISNNLNHDSLTLYY